MPEDKRIKKLATSRTALINSLLDKLEAQIQTGQRELLKRVVDDFVDKLDRDETGALKNTLENKRRFSLFENVYNRFAKDNGLAAVQSIAEGVGKIVDFNAGYFSAFTTAAELGTINANVKDTLSAWLGLTSRGNVQPNGYLDTLIKDASVKNQIKNMVLKAVVSQNGFFQTKKDLQNFIEGNGDKLGALQRYYRNFAYDTFSVVDRTNGKIFADKLKFNYAIYEGGLIETSRKFCEEHNGKVFSRDEIAKFKPTEAIGPGYDPFTDLGGFGCRHHLNWIPDSVAFALRPDLKGTPPAKPAEEQQPPELPAGQIDRLAGKKFSFDKVNDAKEAVQFMVDRILPGNAKAGAVSIHKDMTPERMSAYVNKLNELTADYKVFEGYTDSVKPNVRFESSSKYYGVVTTAGNGRIILDINFGHRTDGGGGRRFDPSTGWFRGKSAVDDANLDVATLVHEFAHVISTDRQASMQYPNIDEFWMELRSLKRKYSTELNKLTRWSATATPEDIKNNFQKAYEIHLGDYASTNNNEFMAEAWTEYKLSSKPSKYAVLVGKLIDKYFKR